MSSIKTFFKKNGLPSRICQNDVNEMVRIAVQEVYFLLVVVYFFIIAGP